MREPQTLIGKQQMATMMSSVPVASRDIGSSLSEFLSSLRYRRIADPVPPAGMELARSGDGGGESAAMDFGDDYCKIHFFYPNHSGIRSGSYLGKCSLKKLFTSTNTSVRFAFFLLQTGSILEPMLQRPKHRDLQQVSKSLEAAI